VGAAAIIPTPSEPQQALHRRCVQPRCRAHLCVQVHEASVADSVLAELRTKLNSTFRTAGCHASH
jgi:hypothetical protein